MILQNVEEGQLIHLFWLDSASLAGWHYDNLEPEPKVIETTGFVVSIGEDAIAITSSRSPTGGVVSPLIIPTCCIREYKIVELR